MNLKLLMGMRPRIVNLRGELAELLIFSKSLSEGELGAVEQHLTRKYGLGG